MEQTVIRFCPACGTRVQAPESVFDGPCACPKCHKRSQFYDYPREVPATPPQPATRPTTTWYDRLLWAAIVVVSLAALLVLWALYEGWDSTAMIGSAVCLISSLAMAGHVVRLKRDLLRSVEAQRRLERTLVVSNSKVQSASEIHQGFKKNFDVLIAEEKLRLQEEIAARQEKTEAMHSEAKERLKTVEARHPGVQIVGDRLLDEGVEHISRELNSSNHSACRSRLMDVIRFCRKNGCKVNAERERELLNWLEKNHQTLLLEAKHSSERQRVEEKMQNERLVLQELEQHIRSAEAERSAVQKALADELLTPRGEDSEEAEYLRERLAAAEQKAHEAEKALTVPTSGYVYVLSNIGSFGQGVFKIGTTRQLDPRQYVKELGASLPFPYDVHMMIATDNAPALEAALQEGLHDCRVNRFDHGKDFFQTEIQNIWRLVVAHHGTVDYVSEPLADEYIESQSMTLEAFQRITEMHKSSETYREPFDRLD